jgi:hypothetical protein
MAGALLALSLGAPAAAAPPSAELWADISDVREEGGSLRFNLAVTAGAPTEDYSSLDFSLVSSDSERLFIEKDQAAEGGDLKITFPEGLGGAFHKGRIGAGGEVSHLIGVFSQSGQNDIGGETPVCDIAMVYVGSDPASLSLEELQLVYIDENNEVASVKTQSAWKTEISRDMLVSIDDAETPMSGPAAGREAEGGVNVVLAAALAALCGAAAAAAAITLAQRRGRKKRAAAPPE